MRAIEILQRRFESDLDEVHVGRVRVLFEAAFTALRSGRVSLTSLGRAIAERTTPKHGIKRIDRLLGNTKLHAELITFYRAIARRLIAPNSRPVLLVDWTAVTPQLWALVAAVCFDGRALIIYAQTHTIARYLKPAVNAEFLYALRKVLPVGCRPIVVTDAGFRTPWMKLVSGFGWDYVGRARAPAKVRRDRGSAWSEIEDTWRFVRSIPTDLGQYQIGSRNRYPCRFVGIRKRKHHLTRPLIRDFGTARQLRNAREPWILATSLKCSAAKVIAIYRTRMQIEETFRDAKSNRYGFSLSQARPRSEQRANVLVLLTSLAHLVAVLLGMFAEAAHIQRRYQANTVTTRRVLSLVMLGRLFAASNSDGRIRPAFAAAAWSALAARTQLAFSP
jgi:hypothetical protein